jgi:mannose-1-phosphate guanylyltransferase/mannose-6-phosphate isomerase
MIIPVILSGGAGTRLWPLSTPARPKPFLRLLGCEGGTLFGATVERVADRERFAAPIIVGSAAHQSLIEDATARARLAPQVMILEPVARNTAAAVAAAAFYVERSNPDAVLVVVPSDHIIMNAPAFADAVQRAEPLAAAGSLVLFGIRPGAARTEYGYIKKGTPLGGEARAFAVAAFCEKPDRKRAEHFVAGGDHYWNSGIFVMTASAYLAELARCEPRIYDAARAAVAKADKDGNVIRLEAAALAAAPDMPIDRAVMERTAQAVMLPLDVGWSDVGSWAALWAALWRNQSGETAQRHSWGYARTLAAGEPVRLRHVHLDPGAALPAQELHTRSHWIVVAGTAKLVCGGQEKFLRENDGFAGSSSPELRIENGGAAPLDLIEIDTGG